MSKRIFDVVLAALALLVLSPVLLGTALAVRWKMGSPVLFRQPRPGLHGHPFDLLKFRTMTDERDAEGKLLPDGERLTRLGQFLRKTSLDEFPELWNVLRGDMSLVGPRPLLMDYLPRYDDVQMRRHEVRPGITGWAQVNGRNAQSWARRFELDVWYVDNRSLWLDLRIIAVTLWKVLRREGISHQGEATMPAFTGTGQPSERHVMPGDETPGHLAQVREADRRAFALAGGPSLFDGHVSTLSQRLATAADAPPGTLTATLAATGHHEAGREAESHAPAEDGPTSDPLSNETPSRAGAAESYRPPPPETVRRPSESRPRPRQ